MTTIFSKIIAGEIPCNKVYEDDLVLAFLDINPLNLGHTLVIPKQPFVDVFEGDEEVLGHMMKIAKRIATAQKEALDCDGVSLSMSNGSAAGQEVFHAHLHVIPRYENDGKIIKAKHEEYESSEVASKMAQQLSSALD